MAERPTSPHLDVYRWGYTMTLSILHRVTGLALGVALIGLVTWLVSASLGPAQYAALAPWFSSPAFKLLLSVAVLALIYHLCNGLRHLAWDIGLGFERADARRSAVVVVIATAIGAAICIFLILSRAGSGP